MRLINWVLCAAPGALAIAETMSCVRSAMRVLRVATAGTAHPFGDERTVRQAFPKAIAAVDADPFLMCDNFAFAPEKATFGEDEFPIGWHPHRGMDILSYQKTGLGRHGDSLGHRETYETPGIQWMSCGSGVEHAEGGGGDGELMKGFQIWVNVPSSRKMDDPRYGTHPPSEIPTERGAGVARRLLAGSIGDDCGPFETATPVQMVDWELEAGASLEHELPSTMDTALLYVYEGGARVNGAAAAAHDVVELDASSDDRGLDITAGPDGCAAMLFAGKKLREPIAWHGPIVMNSQTEIQQAFKELRSGKFPPVRVPWDYKRASARPKK